MHYSLTIIIPVHNEEDNLLRAEEALLNYIDGVNNEISNKTNKSPFQ